MEPKLNLNHDRRYLQSAAIPYIRNKSGYQIVLITNGKRTSWIYPKGVVEAGMSAPESAAKEAFEEAGVTGTIDGTLLSTYYYEKWGGECQVEVFPLEVSEVLDDWDEKGYRDRMVVDAETALEMIKSNQAEGLQCLFEYLNIQV